MTLRRGDIILCKGRGLISWIISKIEHSPVTHVALVVNSLTALEALAQGVVLTPLRKFRLRDSRYCDVVRIKAEYATPQQIDHAVTLACDNLGAPYDWFLLFKLGWAWATKRRHTNTQEGSEAAFICSETIAEPFAVACGGFRFRPEIPVGNTAPKDIACSPFVEKVKL
jgi:uncharacterized protein YycO